MPTLIGKSLKYSGGITLRGWSVMGYASRAPLLCLVMYITAIANLRMISLLTSLFFK